MYQLYSQSALYGTSITRVGSWTEFAESGEGCDGTDTDGRCEKGQSVEPTCSRSERYRLAQGVKGTVDRLLECSVSLLVILARSGVRTGGHPRPLSRLGKSGFYWPFWGEPVE
jgi:hypothetical protein